MCLPYVLSLVCVGVCVCVYVTVHWGHGRTETSGAGSCCLGGGSSPGSGPGPGPCPDRRSEAPGQPGSAWPGWSDSPCGPPRGHRQSSRGPHSHPWQSVRPPPAAHWCRGPGRPTAPWRGSRTWRHWTGPLGREGRAGFREKLGSSYRVIRRRSQLLCNLKLKPWGRQLPHCYTLLHSPPSIILPSLCLNIVWYAGAYPSAHRGEGRRWFTLDRSSVCYRTHTIHSYLGAI